MYFYPGQKVLWRMRGTKVWNNGYVIDNQCFDILIGPYLISITPLRLKRTKVDVKEHPEGHF